MIGYIQDSDETSHLGTAYIAKRDHDLAHFPGNFQFRNFSRMKAPPPQVDETWGVVSKLVG